MREIRFRGKCIAEGELKGKWVYGDLLQKNGKTFITPHANSVTVNGHIGKMLVMHEVSPESVGQFTGLRDKNGKEIYEGDILKNDENVGEVKWVQEHCAFVIRTIEPHAYHLMQYDGKMISTEVIGNIYENPELLQAG